MPKGLDRKDLADFKDQILLILDDYRNTLPKLLLKERTRLMITKRIIDNLEIIMQRRRVRTSARKSRAPSPVRRGRKSA
jgi:hypothetical protein